MSRVRLPLTREGIERLAGMAGIGVRFHDDAFLQSEGFPDAGSYFEIRDWRDYNGNPCDGLGDFEDLRDAVKRFPSPKFKAVVVRPGCPRCDDFNDVCFHNPPEVRVDELTAVSL